MVAQPHTLAHQRLPGRSTPHPHSRITEADHVAKPAISVGKYIYPQRTQGKPHNESTYKQASYESAAGENSEDPLSVGFEP